MTKPRRASPEPPVARGGDRRRALAALTVVAIAGALGWALWKPKSPVGPVPAAAANAASTPGPFAPLVGSWVRPDGGYVLSVSAVSTDGTATASYFNPRPIRVARSRARREGDGLGLFVEFDHPNYPGSTYTLAYDPATDTLRGTYYQAVQQARYSVVFVRRR
jgi:hypothetical protein